MTTRKPVDSHETPYGFKFGSVTVERATSMSDGTTVLILTPDAGKRLEIYISPTGRSMRVFRDHKEAQGMGEPMTDDRCDCIRCQPKINTTGDPSSTPTGQTPDETRDETSDQVSSIADAPKTPPQPSQGAGTGTVVERAARIIGTNAEYSGQNSWSDLADWYKADCRAQARALADAGLLDAEQRASSWWEAAKEMCKRWLDEIRDYENLRDDYYNLKDEHLRADHAWEQETARADAAEARSGELEGFLQRERDEARAKLDQVRAELADPINHYDIAIGRISRIVFHDAAEPVTDREDEIGFLPNRIPRDARTWLTALLFDASSNNWDVDTCQAKAEGLIDSWKGLEGSAVTDREEPAQDPEISGAGVPFEPPTGPKRDQCGASSPNGRKQCIRHRGHAGEHMSSVIDTQWASEEPAGETKPRYIIAPDGYGETTIWWTDDSADPIPVMRPTDLEPSRRAHAWPLIVAALTGHADSEAQR